MAATLVDSNVLLDVLTEDEHWFDWSSSMLSEAARRGILVINPLIYAEVSLGFERIEDLDEALPARYYRRVSLPWDAGFLAGQCFVKYRKRGGRATIADAALLHRRARRACRVHAAHPRCSAVSHLLPHAAAD